MYIQLQRKFLNMPHILRHGTSIFVFKMSFEVPVTCCRVFGSGTVNTCCNNLGLPRPDFEHDVSHTRRMLNHWPIAEVIWCFILFKWWQFRAIAKHPKFWFNPKKRIHEIWRISYEINFVQEDDNVIPFRASSEYLLRSRQYRYRIKVCNRIWQQTIVWPQKLQVLKN